MSDIGLSENDAEWPSLARRAYKERMSFYYTDIEPHYQYIARKLAKESLRHLFHDDAPMARTQVSGSIRVTVTVEYVLLPDEVPRE